MPVAPPQDSTIAVVGDGFGSLLVHATARYVGFAPEQIRIYGTSTTAVGAYQRLAYHLGQTVLRSESESPFLPADWPTFAQLDAWAHRSVRPLVRSIRRRYNPGVPEILTEATVVQRALGWDDARVPVRVGWLQRERQPVPHFVLYDEQARLAGRAKHVMLALGHGPLSFPPVLARAREDPRLADRIVQAYEAKRYHGDGRYVVVGAGIASVNEWANALDAGAKGISRLRSSEPDEQDLNTPRCFFEALGIDEGRFEQVIGEVEGVAPGPAGLRLRVASRHGPDPGWLDVTGVVAGTGFVRSALTLPLVRRLVEHYRLAVEDGRVVLRTNCGVPGLDLEESRLATMGLLANSVVPHGDTIAGLKYVARRFVADCARAERLRQAGLPARLGLQLSLARQTARALRRIRPAEQLS